MFIPSQRRLHSVVHFLPVEGEVEAGLAFGFVMRLRSNRRSRNPRQDRAVLSLTGALRAANADHFGHDAGDFRRGVELPFALARLGGEVAHQIFVSVAENVVALGAVASEVERGIIPKDSDEVGESIYHLLAATELVGVVEISNIDHALEIVFLQRACR